MRKEVGQRENVDPDKKMALALVQTFVSVSGARPTKIELSSTFCNQCNHSVKIFLSEDINTGKIYLEGPDKCPECDNQITDPEAEFPSLTQEQIKHFFGPF